jgi:glycine betaine/proline transport system ATP-binding protein
MKQEGVSTVYAVDEDGRLRGVVRIDDAVELRAKDEDDLSTVLIEDVPTAHEDTPVAVLLPQVFEAELPIAITDDEGRFRGIVDRASVLAEVTTNMENLKAAGAFGKDADEEAIEEEIDDIEDAEEIDSQSDATSPADDNGEAPAGEREHAATESG